MRLDGKIVPFQAHTCERKTAAKVWILKMERALVDALPVKSATLTDVIALHLKQVRDTSGRTKLQALEAIRPL